MGELIPPLLDLQQQRRTIIVNLYEEHAEQQLPDIARSLSPRGLCVIIACVSVANDRRLLHTARQWFGHR